MGKIGETEPPGGNAKYLYKQQERKLEEMVKRGARQGGLLEKDSLRTEGTRDEPSNLKKKAALGEAQSNS